MSSLSIGREVIAALQRFQTTTFSVAELTDAYMAGPNSIHESKKAARQFVYRNMLRLLNAGALERVPNGKRWPVYRLTKVFLAKVDAFTSSEQVTESQVRSDVRIGEKLRERLNLHKLEMLTAMGEAEEYNAICKEWPELQPDVQERYNQARDRCSKILGRVKALENLLARTAG